MFPFEDEAEVIAHDRKDLIELLNMRFGSIPPAMLEQIHQINDFATVSRLILVAANSPTLRIFAEELKEGEASFRIVGERFNPIEAPEEGGEPHSG